MSGLTVSEAWAASKAVVGVCARITLKHFEEKSFLFKGQRLAGTDPDLEVMVRGFNHHATGLPGVIRKLVVTFYGYPIEVIYQKILGLVEGLHEDMPAFGVMRLEVGYFIDTGIEPPESFFEVEHCQLPVSIEKAMQFVKDSFHVHLDSIRYGGG